MGTSQYPYLILVNSLIPALLAGNSVILKPSPQTPTIVERVQEVFAEAGLPDKVIQHFHCGSLTRLESIVRSPQIKLICFTGSVAGGLQVQRAASDRVIPVGLELGGKDPAYIREDADVKWAAEEIVDGAVFNSGQSCCSIERVYVAEQIHDEFVSAVQDVLKGYTLGDPFDMSTNVGPVVSKKSAETIEAHVQDAINKGAKDLTPENKSFASPPAGGNYVRPTLLVNVTHNMRTYISDLAFPIWYRHGLLAMFWEQEDVFTLGISLATPTPCLERAILTSGSLRRNERRDVWTNNTDNESRQR